MADRKKNRRKLDEQDDKPTKEDYAVAKFLRFHVPTRNAKLHNMEVHCFFASAAVDALLQSKWSASKNAKEPLFLNRHSCVSYCQRLIQKGLFHRAERVQRKKDKGEKGEKAKKKKVKDVENEKVKEVEKEKVEKKVKEVEKEKVKEAEKEKDETVPGVGDELRERKKKDKKGRKEKEDSALVKTAEREINKEEEKKEEKKDEGKKKKEKRLKLVMTDDQRFLDGEENIYVWIYDPVNAKTLLIGSLIVLGAIALCLFPLWPEVVRIGVYYVSLTAAGFVGLILSLVVVRLALFCMIWTLTLGRHHFWLLPNLTEDVGFFDSFRPLYKHDAVASPSAKGKDDNKSARDKSKKSKSSQRSKSSDKEGTESEQEEFEMISKGDVEGGEEEGGDHMEGEEDTEDNAEVGEEEEECNEEEDYEEEEEDQNGEEDEEGEEEPEEDETEEKKDK